MMFTSIFTESITFHIEDVVVELLERKLEENVKEFYDKPLHSYLKKAFISVDKPFWVI